MVAMFSLLKFGFCYVNLYVMHPCLIAKKIEEEKTRETKFWVLFLSLKEIEKLTQITQGCPRQ